MNMLIAISYRSIKNCPESGAPIKLEVCKLCASYSNDREIFSSATVFVATCNRFTMTKKHFTLDRNIAAKELRTALEIIAPDLTNDIQREMKEALTPRK